MQVVAKPLILGFIEHKISKERNVWYENGDLRIGGGIYLSNHEKSASISECGKHWCHISNHAPHAVIIVDGFMTERASYEITEKGKRICSVQFTPRNTIFVKYTDETILTELDLDAQVLRHMSICHPWSSVACTKTHIVLSTKTSFEVYSYRTGEHVYSFPVDASVLPNTLRYSSFTRKIYVQRKTQDSLQGFHVNDTTGVITADVKPLIISRNPPIGCHQWCVVHNQDMVILDSFAYAGISFRGIQVHCEQYGVSTIHVIPGGFFLFTTLNVYFIMDNFSYTHKEAFLSACV